MKTLANVYGVSKCTVQIWLNKYFIHGRTCFYSSPHNKHYSKKFKLKCIHEVLKEGYSVNDIVAKYNISSRSVLNSWILGYNANMGLKDYSPKQEDYISESRRKTTLNERKEITEYCIAHNNYKNTAEHFDVSYSQVYMWVKKYREQGKENDDIVRQMLS